MISYNQILKKHTNPELTQDELHLLVKLETITDNCIESQFPNSYVIQISEQSVDQVLKTVNPYRKRIIIENHWKKMYDSGGWNLKLSKDDDYYSLTKKSND